ncbi:hypothetical protein [Desulfococcus sp.]|uniref:hypothetical protein n=1 Tax=Desulfococcus sp. TaxID=2025834 RepID=UPI00359443BF
MAAAILIAGIVVSGVAEAMSQCCGKMPGACITISNWSAAGDAHCHEAPPPCSAEKAEPTHCPPAPEADEAVGNFCCEIDQCDTLRPDEFLQNASPSAMVMDRQAGTADAPGISGGFTPDIRTPFFLSIPLYLLKNALLC